MIEEVLIKIRNDLTDIIIDWAELSYSNLAIMSLLFKYTEFFKL